LALSRVWVVFDLDSLAYIVAEYRQYPWQWIFGAMGSKMSVDAYLINLAAFLATLLLIRFVGGSGATFDAISKSSGSRGEVLGQVGDVRSRKPQS
jgi:hypothetical protein